MRDLSQLDFNFWHFQLDSNRAFVRDLKQIDLMNLANLTNLINLINLALVAFAFFSCAYYNGGVSSVPPYGAAAAAKTVQKMPSVNNDL